MGNTCSRHVVALQGKLETEDDRSLGSGSSVESLGWVTFEEGCFAAEGLRTPVPSIPLGKTFGTSHHNTHT